MMRIGSLCSGYGGLDMAVQTVLGGEIAWHAEIDPAAFAVLAHHWPGVPNLSDLTAVDWATVEPVDIVAGGYPCQPFSNAGLRKGTEDDRHIWPYIATALRVLRPRLALFENVAGHLRRGFDAVLADLAALGFDASWCLVRASQVGAPHRRERLFILAWPADSDGPGLEGTGVRRAASQRSCTAADATHLGHERGGIARRWRSGSPDRHLPPADAAGERYGNPRASGVGELPAAAVAGAVADSPSDRRDEGRPEPARQLGRPDAALSGAQTPPDADRDGLPRRQERNGDAEAWLETSQWDDVDGRVLDWGAYEPAIRRWEHVIGRSAPRPTEPGRTGDRLSPVFVEWLMGLPAGHVTDVPGLSRNAMLRLLGNGVVPQQGAAALRLLLAELEQGAAA